MLQFPFIAIYCTGCICIVVQVHFSAFYVTVHFVCVSCVRLCCQLAGFWGLQQGKGAFCLYGRSSLPTRKHPKWRNRTSGCESDGSFQPGSSDFYLSFLVTIGLSCLVSEIFACDRRTDGQTTQTITIAGPHIVAIKLIMSKTHLKYSSVALVLCETCCSSQSLFAVQLSDETWSPR